MEPSSGAVEMNREIKGSSREINNVMKLAHNLQILYCMDNTHPWRILRFPGVSCLELKVPGLRVRLLMLRVRFPVFRVRFPALICK
jgi:hypothetical protein